MPLQISSFIDHICATAPASVVSHPLSVSLRFHRVSCTLPRCHKERRCRSHRIVRQVSVCVCMLVWEWEREKRNNQPLLFLSHSSWYIKSLSHSGELVSKQNITVTSCLRKKWFAGKKMGFVCFSVGMSVCCVGRLVCNLVDFWLANDLRYLAGYLKSSSILVWACTFWKYLLDLTFMKQRLLSLIS